MAEHKLDIEKARKDAERFVETQISRIRRFNEAVRAGDAITAYKIRFHTADDDKDSGSVVSAIVTTTDGEILAQSLIIGDPNDDWGNQTNFPDPTVAYGFAPNDGPLPYNSPDAFADPGWYKLIPGQATIALGTGAILTIGKTTSDGWNFSVDLKVTAGGQDYVTFQSPIVGLKHDNTSISFNV